MTHSVRFGVDHALSLPNLEHVQPWIQGIVASVAPHVGVIVVNGISDAQYDRMASAMVILKAVLNETGNTQAAMNLVCEKR